ncbi:MAG TPA: Calx-beta domain-containing protein [Tepidisphaeraceae bacterium]|nr:Calx-beta domain-containing protein [Tepidisphaeraceae bacterium]
MMKRKRTGPIGLMELLEGRQLMTAVMVDSASAGESDGMLRFRVALDGPSDHDVVVSYKTVDGTAVRGKDYVAKKGQITIAAGETEGEIDVALVGDQKFELTEKMGVEVSVAGGTVVNKKAVVGTITDDDAVPYLITKNIVNVQEGNGGRHLVKLKVRLSAAAGVTIQVKYGTSDVTPLFDSATAGTDYAATKGVLTFLPGQMSRTIAVPIIGDKAPEADEYFQVTYLPVKGEGWLDETVGSVLIRNDDKAPTGKKSAGDPVVQFTDAVLDGTTPGGVITVPLSKASDHDVTFKYAYTVDPSTSSESGETALGSMHGKVTIRAGQRSGSIPYPAFNTMDGGGSPSVYLKLSQVKGATLINDQPMAEVAISFFPLSDLASYPGDVNMDGVITSADYILIAPYVHPSGVNFIQPVVGTSYPAGETSLLHLGSGGVLTINNGATLSLGSGAGAVEIDTVNSGILNLGSVVTSTLPPLSTLAVNINLSTGGEFLSANGAVGFPALTLTTSPDGNPILVPAGGSSSGGTTFSFDHYILLAGTLPGSLYVGLPENVKVAEAGGVTDDGRVEFWQPGGKLVVTQYPLLVGGLVLAPDTVVDVGNQALIVLGAGGSLDAYRAVIASAYADGTWSGPGIMSSAAAADPEHVGVAYGAGLPLPPSGNSQVVLGIGSSAVVVRPALFGDVNLDGVVDDADLAIVQQSMSDPAARGWTKGDFNYDNVVDGTDLEMLYRNYSGGAGT